MKFGLIGDGKISNRHKNAVKTNGGVIEKVHDPKYGDLNTPLDAEFFDGLDYVIICSPSYLHREHIKLCLQYDKRIICEKPMCLPWEPAIDDDRVNIVLQLRWLNGLPKRADLIKVVMARNEEYFKLWEGDPRLTGGLLYHLFIHYIDLALVLNAKFEGVVIPEGEQVRMIDDYDIFKVDMDLAYADMYSDIINYDKGVKPRDLFYLHWWLDRNSDIYGYGTDLLNKKIIIEHERTII